jgi:hypothetical protein
MPKTRVSTQAGSKTDFAGTSAFSNDVLSKNAHNRPQSPVACVENLRSDTFYVVAMLQKKSLPSGRRRALETQKFVHSGVADLTSRGPISVQHRE